MAHEIVKDDIPGSFIQGNSVSWKKSLSDFPATSWTLKYFLVNAVNQITIAASASGTDHLVEISPTTSAAYLEGDYSYHEIIEKSDNSERYKLSGGEVSILPNFESQSSGYDARSWVKQTLDAIRAVITKKVPHDRANYSVHGRQLSAYSWQEILDLEKEFQARYNRERRKSKGRSSSVKVQFS